MAETIARPLEGSVSIVTGAGGGLGRATCAALTEAGSTVVGTDVVEPLEGCDVALWLQHDVSSADAWRRVVEEVEGRFGRLDCVINNAAIVMIESLEQTTIEAWRRVQSVNVESVLLSFHAAVPLLRASGAQRKGGSAIVNVTSPAGFLGSPFAGAYAASKAAVANMTRTAVREFGKLGYPIRVNNLHPGGSGMMGMGATVRERYRELGLASSDDERNHSISTVPIGRDFEPSEVAAGIVFLCSPSASYITGVTLPVSGGELF